MYSADAERSRTIGIFEKVCYLAPRQYTVSFPPTTFATYRPSLRNCITISPTRAISATEISFPDVLHWHFRPELAQMILGASDSSPLFRIMLNRRIFINRAHLHCGKWIDWAGCLSVSAVQRVAPILRN